MSPPDTKKTPIKVPGKRSRSSMQVDVKERKKPNRSRGRPLKTKSVETSDATSDRSTRPRKKLNVGSLKNIKSKRDMSPLERLPTEILEQIFFHSMNFDLPRSSPVIGWKLSSEAVYNRTIISAFGVTWEMYYTILEQDDAHFPIIDGPDKLQSAVLRCRWASLPRLLQSQDVYMRRQRAQRVALEPILKFTPNEEERDRHFIQGNPDLILDPKITVTERFSTDFQCFLDSIKKPDFNINWNIDKTIIDANTEYQRRDIAKGVEIPHSLLLGPWTEDMTRYLYWLAKSGATVNWVTSTSGEAALLGFKEAIKSGNLPVTFLLVWVGVKHKLDVPFLTWVVQNLGDNHRIIMLNLLIILDLVHDDQLKLNSEVRAEHAKAKLESDEKRLAFLDWLRILERSLQYMF